MSLWKILKNKETKNAMWLIGGRVAQMFISLVVGVLTARFLGPTNYGLISYGTAFVVFFTAFCTLGINSVIIKDFVDHPHEQGSAIGSSILLRFLSSIGALLLIIGISFYFDSQEPETVIVVTLCGLSLLFQVFDTFNYWFQFQYQSKVIAIATFLAYIATAAYRIILLMFEKNIKWFALASSVDYIVLAVVLVVAYQKYNGPKLTFSLKKGKSLLSKSYHYILSGMMVAVYGQTDRLMLKQMVDDSSVGYYSIAATVNFIWVFVLASIINAVAPTIINLHKEDYQAYEKKNQQLYAIVFYVSMGVSLIMTLWGDSIIQILYGEDFLPSSSILKIITWYTAFAYLGVARDTWIVCENKQHYLKYLYMGAALLNVLLNCVMIPQWGASGAAVASLCTQISTSIILPCCIKGLRPNVILIMRAIFLKK